MAPSSWLDIPQDSPFSLANIPFGIITTSKDASPHVAIAIGDYVLDLKALSAQPDFTTVFPTLADSPDIFAQPTLNAFAALGRQVHRQVRNIVQDILSTDTSHPNFLRDNETARQESLILRRQVKSRLPMTIGDYTDFYAGYHHAYAVGVMFRGPENALQPNYTHLPVGYHGRASSIRVSPDPVRRPWGQILLDPTAQPKQPILSPSRKMDFELELGCLLCKGNVTGAEIKVNDADDHIFGYVLLNDWSARDIQTWEYVPLGPFNSKNFASTISPWVVLADALEPFRVKPIENKNELQDYLKESKAESVFDIGLEIDITTAEGDTTTISRVSSKHLLWSFPQMIAHHTLGGCPMNTGDLLGSGTISGTGSGERGSLLEMSEGGKKDVLLYGMDARRFLKDGDIITITGTCGESGARVGFGECKGRVETAVTR